VIAARTARCEGCIVGVGGLRLRYRTWEATAPRAAMLIVHGLGEHGGRYAGLASALTASGVSCYALDLRGHGTSEGRRGHSAEFDCFLQDLDRFRREVDGLNDPEIPLFLLGHSMGGLIVLRYLEEYDARLSGAVLMSPWLATALPVAKWKVTLAGTLGHVLPALPFSTGIRPEALSRDPAAVRAYREDPLVHTRITPRLFTGTAEAMGLVLRRGDRIGVPLLVLLAGDDRITDAERGAALVRALPADRVEVRSYPGCYHELINDIDRDVVIADVRGWIAARLSDRPTA